MNNDKFRRVESGSEKISRTVLIQYCMDAARNVSMAIRIFKMQALLGFLRNRDPHLSHISRHPGFFLNLIANNE